MTLNPIIVALDFESAREAFALVDRLGDRVSFYKVGMELYAAAGMEAARELRTRGKDVFLDMKFYDIGETVRRAVCQVARAGVQFLTVHGSAPVLKAAMEGRGTSNLKLLAVTVLTAYDQQDIEDLGYPCELSSLVDLRVHRALEAGVDGIVASALDAKRIREIAARRIRDIAGPEPLLVTPGVRSAGNAPGDQKRVATPAEAVRDGADYVVLGRQITRAADPPGEVARVLDEIAAAHG
jgi:orotidine-5'-phosphate decarboxylase